MSDKISYKAFSASIKAKYPEYSEVDDLELSTKMIEKYPEYADRVTLTDNSDFMPGGKMSLVQPTPSTPSAPLRDQTNFLSSKTGDNASASLSNQSPITEGDKMRLGSFPVQAPTLNLEDKPAGQFYKPLPRQTSLYNPRLRENDMTGLTEEKTADTRPALQKEFIAPTGESIKQGYGAQEAATAQSAEYLANPQEQAQAQWELLNSTPQKYGTPRKDQFGNVSWDLTADDQEYMNSLFDQLPEWLQVEEWKKNPEKWDNRPHIQALKTAGDNEQSIFGDNWLGDASLNAGDYVQSLNSGAAGLLGGVSELMHQKFEKPLWGWMSKDPNSRQIWGRIADFFFEDQAASQSLATSAQDLTFDETGQPRQKRVFDYAAEGDIAGLADDLVNSGLQSAPTSIVAMGAGYMGMPSVGMAIIGASSYGQRKRELDQQYPDMPEWKKDMIAVPSAAVEVLSERLGSIQIGKTLAKIYGKAGYETAEIAMKNTAEAIIDNTVKNLKNPTILKMVGKSMYEEGIKEELPASLGNYAIDVAAGLRQYDTKTMLLEGAESAIYGGFSGGVFGLIGAPGINKNKKIAKQLETLKSQYDTANSNMQNAFADSEFEFEGEKIITLPLAQQQQILPAVYEAENLSDAQKTAIRDYMEAGNNLNAALVNVGLTNIELLRKKANAFKEVQESINDKTGKVDVITIQGTADTQQYNVKSGTVALDNEGKVDTQNSDEAIYYYTGAMNEDGTPEVSIITPESISELTQLDPKEELKSRFTEIEAEEFVRSEFGSGMQIQVNSDAGLLPATVVAVTPTGLIANVQGQEVELSFAQAVEDVEAVESQAQTQTPTGEQQTTYARGTSVVVNGTTFVVGEQDEAGNYMINDEAGQPLDRFTPDEMAEFGFSSVAVRPTQAEQVVSGDMTENAPVTAESAPVQYPLNKKGEIDFDAMTVAQTYEYMVDNYGQEEANNGLSMQEKSIQALISQNIKALSKVNEQLYGQLRTAKTIQEQLKIREKNKATITKLTDERTALDTQLAEIRALMPVVEQTPTQPEVMAVKGSNVRPEEQLRREQEAKQEAEKLTAQQAKVKEETPEISIEEKKADIKRRRQEELNRNVDSIEKKIKILQSKKDSGNATIDDLDGLASIKNYKNNYLNDDLNKINAKYDAELAALESAPLQAESAPVAEVEEQPVIEVREKEEWKGTPQWTRRLINLGDAMTVEDVVLRRIAGGAKFVWTASAPLKGLAEELGFTNKPGERKLRKNLIDNENGMTPQEFAHVIYESGDLDFMPGVEYQDVYNAVVETLLQVNSATMAMEKAEANRNKYDMMQEDYDIYRSITPEEWAYIEEIPDEILAGYLGITNFSPEQIDFIFNIQNEYYANEQQQTPANAEPADTSTSERSEAPESTTSSGTDKIEPTAEILAISEKLVNKQPLTTEEQSVYKNADNKRMFNEAVGRIIAAKDEEDEKKQQAKKKAKKSKPETTTPQSQIQQVLDNYNDAENMTMNDVINDILSLAYDNDITAIQEAYKTYQDELREDREQFGERGDREAIENNFMQVVNDYLNQSEQPLEKLTQAELDTQELDAYIAGQAHNSNPTEKQKETGIYDKARISLQGHNITLETLKNEQRSGVDSNGKAWAINMNNHYGELDGTTGYDGDAIDVFVGPNPKQGQIFVVDQVTPDGAFDESKVMLGFDSAEEAKAAYMSNYEAGWQGFGSITPAGDNFKTWLYDGKKQRKPFAEYKETPEAVEVSDQSVDVNEMIEKPAEATSAPQYKNGDTVYYQGKQYVINGIYNGVLAYDLETAAGKLAFEEVAESELSNQAPAPRSILDVAVEQVKKNEEKRLTTTETSQDIIILQNSDNYVRFETKDKKSYADIEKNNNKWHIEMIESSKKGDGTKIINSIISEAKKQGISKITLSTTEGSGWGFFNKLGFKKYGNNNDPFDIPMELLLDAKADKVSAAQAEADAALQDFLDAFNDLNSDNLGIVDNTAEKQAKMLVAGTKMVGAYTRLGVYKFADLVKKIQVAGVTLTEDLLSAIKKAYGAFAAENDIDELDDMKTVRQFTLNNLQQKKNEDLTPKTDNLPKNDVSLTDNKFIKDHIIFGTIQKTNDNGQPRSTEIIESEAAVSETTSAAITNSASNVGSDKQRAGEVKEQATEQIKSVESLLAEVDNKLANLRLTDKSYSTDGIYADYPINVLAKGEIKKDLTKYIKAVAEITGLAHDTDKKGKTEIVNVNIAPAGGDATFFLWSKTNPEHGVYVSIPYDPDYSSGGGYDNYKVLNEGWRAQILYRVVNKAKKYDGSNQYMPTNVTAQEMAETLLKGINAELKSKGLAEEQVQDTKQNTGLKITKTTNDNGNSKQRVLQGSNKRLSGTAQPDLFSGVDSGEGTGGSVGTQSNAVSGADAAEQQPTGRTGSVLSGNVDVLTPALVPFNAEDNDTQSFNQSRKYDDNIAAIETLITLVKENRKATPDEKAILSNYVGFGGLKDIVLNPESADGWKESSLKYRAQVKRIVELATEFDQVTGSTDSLAKIKGSILNAHFTSSSIIRSVYDGVQKLGFKSGRMLEPSAGIGNFITYAPERIKANSSITAVELDNLTGNILKYLHDDVNVKVSGIQDAQIPNNSQDLVISNVPFGNYKIFDKAFKGDKAEFQNRIHNYFFAKAVDMAREGGIIAFVTSKGVMDSPSNENLRIYLDQQTEFLGAVRLPNDAFKNNANTEVVTDIIFLKKNSSINKNSPNFVKVFKVKAIHKDGEQQEVNVNQYFVDNPQNMLGSIVAGGLYSREDYTVENKTGYDLSKAIKNALPAGVYEKVNSKIGLQANDSQQTIDAIKEGNIEVTGGRVVRKEEGQLTDISINEPQGKIEHYIRLRNALMNLIYSEYLGKPDSELNAIRQQLNTEYDTFVKKHGKLSKNAIKIAKQDADGFNVLSLEVADKKDGKADIFRQRTIQPIQNKLTAESVDEAIVISLYENASIDVERIAELLNKTVPEVLQEAKGKIFEQPEGGFVTREEYLSGNVKAKLRQAQEAVDKGFSEFAYNVEQLMDVIPADIPAMHIEARLGSRWIPQEVYTEFAQHLFNTPSAKVIYQRSIDAYSNNGRIETVEAHSKWGTARRNGSDILLDALHINPPKIFDTIKEFGQEKRVLNQDETKKAVEKYEEIRAEFENWVYKAEERRTMLARIYNEKYNTTVKRSYNGDHLNIAGINGVELRPHQKDAIWMLLQNNGGIIDHLVGAGKTFVMVAGTMEMKRTGIAKKPMIIALKSTIPQIVETYRKAYPMAKILAPLEKDFTKDNRRKLFSQIANNEWDVIIMSHENYGKIPHEADIQRDFLRAEMQEIEDERGELEAAGEKQALKGLEIRLKNLEARLEKISDIDKDNSLTFEQMGIDHIMVDESQQFKNLSYVTKQRGVAGLSKAEGSKRAFNLFIGIRYLQQKYGEDKGTTFLSGTPISNSMVEMYLLLKYLRPGKMAELGFNSFDAWATTFASPNSDIEFTVTGDFKSKTRFREFINVPELSMLYTEIADIRTDANTPLDKPKMKGGGYSVVEIKMSDDQIEYGQRLMDFARTKDGHHIGMTLTKNQETAAMLLATNLSSKMAIDMRLIDSSYDYDPNGKIAKLVDNVERIYNETSEHKGTQLIFSDLGTPKNKTNKTAGLRDYMEDEMGVNLDTLNEIFGNPDEAGYKYPSINSIREKLSSILELTDAEIDNIISESEQSEGAFNVYGEVRKRLVEKGIPEEQVVFIHDYNSQRAKEKLFKQIQNGEIRIVLGSTQKLGTGVNVQDRVVAVHHLDVPWTPASMEQRNGRAIRQGNWVAKNHYGNELPIYAYATERTLDAYKYQLLQTKQRFLDQVKSGDVEERTVRESDGDSESGVGYAELVAMLSGNTDILLKAKLETLVQKLTKSKRNYLSEIYEAQDKKQKLEERIPVIEGNIAKTTENIETITNAVQYDAEAKMEVSDINGEKLVVKNDKGKVVPTERIDYGKRAAEIAKAKLDGASYGNIVKLFSQNGFDFYGSKRNEWVTNNGKSVETEKRYIVLRAKNGVEYNVTYSETPGVLLNNIQKAIQGIPSILTTQQSILDKANKDIVAYNEIISKGTEWEKEPELTKALNELKEVTKRLDDISTKDQPQPPTDGDSDEAPKLHTGTTMQRTSKKEVSAMVEQLFKTGLAKEVRMVTPEEIAGILEGNEQMQVVNLFGRDKTQQKIDYLRGIDIVKTDETRTDEDYDPDDAEYTQQKVYIPVYLSLWEYADNTNPDTEEFSDIDEALMDLQTPGDYSYIDSYFTPSKTIRLELKEAWIDKNGDIIEESDNLLNVDDTDDLPVEFKNKLSEYTNTYDSFGTIDTNTFEGREDSARELENKVYFDINKDIISEYDGYKVSSTNSGKYRNIYVEKGEESDVIQLRIADHSYNPNNNDLDARQGKFISIEIANVNPTEGRFHGSYGIQFDGSDTYEDVVEEVNDRIKEIIDNIISVQFFRTPTGTIYGFVKGGVVYLNSTTPNLNTPIHEFGHLWVDAIEGSELYNRGAELVKGTPYWERVNTDPNYKDLSETARTKEAMAMAIGDKGEAVKRNLGLFASIKVWIADVWTRIGAKFGIQNLTPEQIQNLTFNDFVDVAVSELLTPSPSGIPLKKGKAGAMPATIDVDGVQRPTTNSTGKPIHSTEEGIRNFWRWFGDSKVVDKEGRPKVVYHGGASKVNKFDPQRAGEVKYSDWGKGIYFTPSEGYADMYRADYAKSTDKIANRLYDEYVEAAKALGTTPMDKSIDLGYGSEKYNTLSKYEKKWRERLDKVKNTRGEIYPVYLNISNPMRYRYEGMTDPFLSQQAKDNGNDGIIVTPMTEYVVFEPTQIKSATGNNGGFDGSDPDIRYQVGPEKPEFKGDLGEFAQQTTEYNEQQAERATRISKMQRLQEIMVAKSALAARHRNKEVSNQEYAKQMTALHEEKQRVMKGLPTSTSSVTDASTSSVTDASTSSTTEIDDPKPVRAIGQSIAEYATQIADWNYRQTIARALAKTASSVTGGLPPVDDDTDISGDMLRLELDQRLGGFFGRLVEGWQDNIRSVRIFQDMLNEKGTRISDFNNFHMQYTAIQGKNDAHLKDFGKRFMEAINANVLNIQKYTNYEYRDLENYVFLKHGIERNEYMRQAAAEEAVNEKLPKLTQEQIDGDIDGSLQDEYKAAYEQFLEEETAKVADKDYSGLFAVAAEIWAKQNGERFNPKKKGDVARIQKMDEFKADRDAVIVEYIAKFEKTISETIIPTAVKGEELTINGFWAAINAATHYSLDRLVTSGIESKEEVDDLKARYKYYVPLRGHEVEAEKIWQYEAPDNKNVVSKAIMQASGRGSRAEHPFAYIIQMAQTSINKANRNQLNQTILRLARLDKSGLMSVSETWYVLTGTDPDSGKEIWTETEPEFSEDHEIRAGEIRAWNEKMTKLEEEAKARRFKKGLRIGGLFIKPKQKRQHAITIFEDGVSYQVYINGNPRVSQAINELNGTKWNIPIITQTTRFISSMITSRSPQFMLTNGARDLAFASSILPSKEGARYTGQFLKNYPVAMAILANNATFDFGNDKARYKKYLKEFEMNGGETGYSHLLELQDIQKELYKKQKGKNYLNPLTDLDAIISVVDAGNKVIENSTRLAVYIASRESGRSIERSVSDSKEVTLNFNRRGSGIMGAAHVSSIFMFVNAGVQALANFGHVYKMHPVKMSATIGAYAAVGFIMPMIINMIGGDDDEKEYMNMTDWERQTNLCLPTGSGFAKIPLPQEMRVFFKLGDEVYKLYSGRTEASETAMATLLSAADMIPISPLGTIAAGEIGDFGDLQRAISPDALRGVAELATNTNFMGGQIYDKYKADKDELPGYQKARLNRVGEPRAPESIVGFTKWLDHFTGGNDVEKGAVSWNPDIVNHLAKSYLGGMYSLVAEGEKSFTKRFYTSNADIEEKNTTVKDYYKRIREAEEVLRQDKGYWEQVEKGEISEDTYNKEIPPALLEKAYTIHDYGNTITKIERLLKTGDLTPDDELYYKHMSDSLKMEVIRIR